MNQFRPPPQPIPLLGQQKKQFNAQIQAAINSLSLQIYSHLATSHIASRDEHQQIEPDHLRQLAKNSAIAARAFFEGVGLIPQQEGEEQ